MRTSLETHNWLRKLKYLHNNTVNILTSVCTLTKRFTSLLLYAWSYNDHSSLRHPGCHVTDLAASCQSHNPLLTPLIWCLTMPLSLLQALERGGKRRGIFNYQEFRKTPGVSTEWECTTSQIYKESIHGDPGWPHPLLEWPIHFPRQLRGWIIMTAAGWCVCRPPSGSVVLIGQMMQKSMSLMLFPI